MSEAIAAYWVHVEAYYVKDGRPTSEVESIRHALRPLRRLYGRLPATECSPLKLKAVRRAYIEASYSKLRFRVAVSW